MQRIAELPRIDMEGHLLSTSKLIGKINLMHRSEDSCALKDLKLACTVANGTA